jgi:hypothetical protein
VEDTASDRALLEAAALRAVQTVSATFPVLVKNLGADVASGIPLALLLSSALPSWFPPDYLETMVRSSTCRQQSPRPALVCSVLRYPRPTCCVLFTRCCNHRWYHSVCRMLWRPFASLGVAAGPRHPSHRGRPSRHRPRHRWEPRRLCDGSRPGVSCPRQMVGRVSCDFP